MAKKRRCHCTYQRGYRENSASIAHTRAVAKQPPLYVQYQRGFLYNCTGMCNFFLKWQQLFAVAHQNPKALPIYCPPKVNISNPFGSKFKTYSIQNSIFTHTNITSYTLSIYTTYIIEQSNYK